jgi:hypothetical protein
MPEIIPVHANVHYKSAFDVTCQDTARIMTSLRKILRQWCLDKVGNDPLLYRSWFYIGNNPKVEPAQYSINGHQLRTVSAPSDDPNEPTCWAMELIHSDSEYRARKWSVEVTLRNNPDGKVRFATIVKHWMAPYFIGEYPEPPVASTPGYVRAVLEAGWLTCSKGDARILSRPWYVNNSGARELFERLRSQDRLLPFVLVSRTRVGDAFCIDPVRLENAVLGNANVYPLDNGSVNDELAYYLGDDGRCFRCEVGSVRAYLPRLDLKDPETSRYHRYFSESFITEHGPDAIIGYFTNGLSRNAGTFQLNELLSFQSILSERRKHAIRRLAETSQEKSEEASMLWEDNEDLNTKASEWESLATQCESENQELRRETGELRYRVQEADRVRRTIDDLQSQVKGIKSLSQLPNSLEDVLTAVCSIFPTRIEMTEDAKSSAREYGAESGGFWNKQEQLSLAWGMAFELATKLWAVLFESEAGNPEDDFNAQSSFRLAMSEGKQTKKDANLMKLRRIMHNNKELDITPHLKYGNKPPKMLRMHFHVDGNGKKLIIGHCGEHLDNYSTRKQ